MTILAPAACLDMNDVRAAIDKLDNQLVDLLAVRVQYVERAAALKPSAGIPANAPDRVRLVLERVEARAATRGLPTDLARVLWRDLIDWGIAREKRLMTQTSTEAN